MTDTLNLRGVSVPAAIAATVVITGKKIGQICHSRTKASPLIGMVDKLVASM